MAEKKIEVNDDRLWNMFQNSRYKMWHAVADIADNSIDANAERVKIKFAYDDRTNSDVYAYVADDGNGIEDWEKVLSIGSREKYGDDRLGSFGVGLKTAGASQAHEISIYSRPNGATNFTMWRISTSLINEREELWASDEELPNPVIPREEITRLFEEEGFNTVVLLENVHSVDLDTSFDSTPQKTFSGIETNIRCHLGMTFHRILEKEKPISMDINGATIKPIDPFLSHENSRWHGVIRVEDELEIPTEDGSKITAKVAMCVMPHKSKLKDPNYVKDVHHLKPQQEMQGMYVYRNDRLLDYGGWQGLLKGNMNEVKRSLARCSIEIPPGTEKLFGVTSDKSEVQLSNSICKALLDLFEFERDWGALWTQPHYEPRSYLKVSTSSARNRDAWKKNGIAGLRYTQEGNNKIAAPYPNDAAHPDAPKPPKRRFCEYEGCDGEIPQGQKPDHRGYGPCCQHLPDPFVCKGCGMSIKDGEPIIINGQKYGDSDDCKECRDNAESSPPVDPKRLKLSYDIKRQGAATHVVTISRHNELSMEDLETEIKRRLGQSSK